MPASAQPKLDLSQYLDMIGPVLADKWKQDTHNHASRTIMADFLSFIVQRKKYFIETHGNTDIYFDVLSKVWESFSDKEINTPRIRDRTMLLRVIYLTQDPETVLFAIERTSDSGINIRSPQPVIGEHYALLSALNHKLKPCLEPLISRSNSITVLESAKEGLASFGRMKTRFKDRPCSLKDAYTPEEIKYYTEKINQRISQIKWSRLPVLGPMIRKALVVEIPPQKPKSLSSGKLSSSAPKAIHDPKGTVNGVEPTAQPVHG